MRLARTERPSRALQVPDLEDDADTFYFQNDRHDGDGAVRTEGEIQTPGTMSDARPSA